MYRNTAGFLHNDYPICNIQVLSVNQEAMVYINMISTMPKLQDFGKENGDVMVRCGRFSDRGPDTDTESHTEVDSGM
eukprot:g44552.t1